MSSPITPHLLICPNRRHPFLSRFPPVGAPDLFIQDGRQPSRDVGGDQSGNGHEEEEGELIKVVDKDDKRPPQQQ